MKRRLFNLSNILLAAALISLLAAAAACKTAPTSTTPAASAQPSAAASTPTPTRPSGTFTRTPSSSANPTASATPSRVPSATPTAAASPTASIPASTPIASATPTASATKSPQATTPAATSTSVAVFPIVSITAPYYMSTIPAGDVNVNIVISNFKVIDKTGQAAAPGEGHIVYYLDVTPPTTAGQPATPATGLFADSTATSYAWHNVTSGMHSFSVQLVNNDDTPLSPPVTTTESVIVK